MNNKNLVVCLFWFCSTFLSQIFAQLPVVPSNSAVNVSQSITSVSWSDFDDGNGSSPLYDVQFSNTGAFAGEEITLVVSGLSASLPALSYNSNYYWRVRDNDIDGLGTPGPWFNYSFKTDFPNLSLNLPANGANVSTTPTLSWNTSAPVSNVDYTINISGPNGYSATITTTSPYTFGSPLDYGTYTWSVTIDDNNTPLNNASFTTPTRTFNVYPSLLTPPNTITGVSVEPEFSWEDDGNSTYLLEISNSNTFSTIIASYNGTGGSYNFNESDPGMPLNNDQFYYWRVTVNSLTTPPFSFKTTANVGLNLSHPGNASLVYQYNPLMFSWYLGQPQGTLRFSLQLIQSATTPTQAQWATEVDNYVNGNPHNFAHFSDNLSTTFQSVSGLLGGLRYYWRVVAYYDNGTVPNQFDYSDKVVRYSSVYYFDTNGGAVLAYPSWPAGGYTIYTLTPYYYWYTLIYQPGLNFTVVVSPTADTDSDGKLDDEAGSFTISAGTNYYAVQPSNLLENTTYYWQVISSYNSVNTYSGIESFVTYAPSAVTAYVPVPSWPVGGVTIYTTSPFLHWWVGGPFNNLLFDLQWGTDPTLTVNTTVNGISNLFYQLSGLSNGTTYYWRVRSVENGNPANFSAWSAIQSFSVVGGASSYTVATWPVGNPIVYTDLPTLSWYVEGSTSGWSGYRVKWQANTAPSNWASVTNVADVLNINQMYYTFTSPLNYGTTYYWAVALYDGVNNPTHSEYSQGSFTLVGGPSVSIVLTHPADLSTIYTQSPTLYWYVNGTPTGITSYQLIYSQQSDFSGPTTVTVSGIPNTFYALSGLVPGATYYWKVRGHYSGSTYTSWSPTFEFVVDAGASPVAPKIGSPNNVNITANSPTLSWFLPVQSTSQLRYKVELASNSNFTNAQTFDNVSNLQQVVSNLGIGQYYWRVRSYVANNPANQSGYSPTGSFTVNSPSSADNNPELVPQKFEVAQNYPNPFNPSTVISVALPENSGMNIKIYNALGQEIMTLVDGNFTAGNYNFTWNGTDNSGKSVSAGIYFYRVEAGKNTAVRKMVLMK